MSVFADEGELLERARMGDGDAFASLLRTNDRAMRACAWQLLGNQSLMDDALQDAYIKAYQSIDSFRSESKFSSWLYRIVYRTCLDHQRYRARRPAVPLLMDDIVLPAAEQSAEQPDHADQIARRHELQDALAKLPADQAAVVIMVDAEGLSYEQVGEALDLPKGTIASRLSRARSALRQLLAPPSPPAPPQSTPPATPPPPAPPQSTPKHADPTQEFTARFDEDSSQ